MTLIFSSRNYERGLTKTILGSLQKTRRNASVLKLKLTSSWQGVSNKDGTEVCKNIQLRFIETSRLLGCDEKFRLMIRKGVDPYEYMDSSKKN